MSGLDDLYSQIPVQQIAGRLGVDESEVDSAVKTLVPVLVGGLKHNAEDPGTAQGIASAADSHARSGLLDGGISVEQVDMNPIRRAPWAMRRPYLEPAMYCSLTWLTERSPVMPANR